MTKNLLHKKCIIFINDLIFEILCGTPKKFSIIKGNGKFDPDPIRTKYKNTQHMIHEISKNLRDFTHDHVFKSRRNFKSRYFQENQIYPILKQIPILSHIRVYYNSLYDICNKVSNIMFWYRKFILYKIILLSETPMNLLKI